jgi:hypothetical protein
MSSEFDFEGVIGMLPAIWAIVNQSALFAVLKAFLIIYSLVIIANVVMLLILRGVSDDLKVQFYGAKRPLMSKSKIVATWDGIERRLRSDNPSHYKAAILEADHFVDTLLRESGFAGKNMGERLATLHPGQLENYEGLRMAHTIRNRIVNEPNFTVDRTEAEDLLAKYKAVLVELELFS